MMHRCSSSQGNMAGPCSCGLFHSQSNSFSMLFSMPNHKPFDHYNHDQSHHDMYSYTSPSSVDCTLSLGTPSTRLSTTTNEDYHDEYSSKNSQRSMRHERRNDSCVSNFCWDLLQSNTNSTKQQTTSHKNAGRSGGNSTTTNNNSNDSLLARRCANCDTTSTPLWRNGPRGPKSLCNACGIRFKKEERRAAATSTANGAASGVVIESSHVFGHHNNPWSNIHHQQYSQAQKMPCFSPAIGNEFRFMDDENHEPAVADSTGISFLSWRLNVTDRPSLVHDFTR
ncbi:GATA transcription factor [Trema orientale]|uniref:GATA transcription factor n=1 Tax=Trema orientale TaxID=63057 RepID=A0A2P5FXL8_TREOI|nr:GATA transcription factor [Trema orientale]